MRRTQERRGKERNATDKASSLSQLTVASDRISQLPSHTTGESSPSIQGHERRAADRLVALLYEDKDLRRLYNEALSETSPSDVKKDFAENLQLSLFQLSLQLRVEADTVEEWAVAHLIEKASWYAANTIRNRLPSHHDTPRVAIERLDSPPSDEGYNLEAGQTFIDNVSESTDLPKDFENFILQSNSSGIFKQSLREFLLNRLDSIRLALLEFGYILIYDYVSHIGWYVCSLG
jgi:hypothetical protein